MFLDSSTEPQIAIHGKISMGTESIGECLWKGSGIGHGHLNVTRPWRCVLYATKPLSNGCCLKTTNMDDEAVAGALVTYPKLAMK